MKYLLAVLVPPLTVLFYGTFGQFLLNVLLTIIGWIPGAAHAAYVVSRSDKN